MKKAARLNFPSWCEPHAGIRTDAYMLLAALLTSPPSQDLLDLIMNLSWDENLPDKLQKALEDIGRAIETGTAENISEEYNRLFVGLGSGELVPYGSWYREKNIQSAPLAAIRFDLGRLGIVRQSDTFESEDHAGALCEIMALLSNPDNGIGDTEQGDFFEQHIAPWMFQFFEDLQAVGNGEFYPAVGNLGSCFLEGERSYLQYLMQAENIKAPQDVPGAKFI